MSATDTSLHACTAEVSRITQAFRSMLKLAASSAMPFANCGTMPLATECKASCSKGKLRNDSSSDPHDFSSPLPLSQAELGNLLTRSESLDLFHLPDGTSIATVRCADGFRRTIISRSDGATIQRVSSPYGQVLHKVDSDEKVFFAM